MLDQRCREEESTHPYIKKQRTSTTTRVALNLINQSIRSKEYVGKKIVCLYSHVPLALSLFSNWLCVWRTHACKTIVIEKERKMKISRITQTYCHFQVSCSKDNIYWHYVAILNICIAKILSGFLQFLKCIPYHFV